MPNQDSVVVGASSGGTLLADFNIHTQEALWMAIRSMEGTILLLRRMAGRLREQGTPVRKAVMTPESWRTG